jgi:hypothetical protein
MIRSCKTVCFYFYFILFYFIFLAGAGHEIKRPVISSISGKDISLDEAK